MNYIPPGATASPFASICAFCQLQGDAHAYEAACHSTEIALLHPRNEYCESCFIILLNKYHDNNLLQNEFHIKLRNKLWNEFIFK